MKSSLTNLVLLLLIPAPSMAQEINDTTDWDRISDWTNYIGILGTFLIAVAIFYTGSRSQDKMKSKFEARAKEAEKEIALAKTDAAKANQGAENARADASKANVEAAKANKLAEELKSANLTLENQLAETSKSIEEQKTVVARLQIEAAQAKERQAIAETELIKLKESLRRRTLTEAQKVALLEELRNRQPQSISILYQSTDDEAAGYGEEFKLIFEQAGWTVGLSFALNRLPQKGLVVMLGQHTNRILYMVELMEIFDKIGIECTGGITPEPSGAVLVIGTKNK